jgi:hypothetical protein
MTMEALSSSPKCVSSLFLKRGDKDDSICSLDHFLKELPSALQKRKIEAINPGASNDPVSILLGCVVLLGVVVRVLLYNNNVHTLDGVVSLLTTYYAH